MMRQQLCSSCLYHPSKSLPSLSLYLVHVVCIYPHACYSFLHLSPFFWVQFSFARSKSYPVQFSSVQFSSVTQSCPTLCDPMNRSMPGLPVHHQHPESTQTHIHWIGDAIQPSQPLLYPSPLPSIFPSIRVFSNESALRISWPKKSISMFLISFVGNQSFFMSNCLDFALPLDI